MISRIEHVAKQNSSNPGAKHAMGYLLSKYVDISKESTEHLVEAGDFVDTFSYHSHKVIDMVTGGRPWHAMVPPLQKVK